MGGRARVVAVGAVAAVLAGLLGFAAAAAPAPPCRPATTTVFRPLGGALPRSPLRLTACGGSTGFGAVESRIAATPRGVVFDPAETADGTEGAAFTTDGGASWHLTQSGGGIDGNVYADPVTGRIFRLTFGAGASHPENHGVAFTNDGGRTWKASDTGACCVDGENSRIVAARPRSSKPVRYPNVVYLCSNSSLAGGVGYPAGARVCSKSLDGGATFSLAGPLFAKPVPVHPECAPYGGEYFAASEGAYPQAGPDGTLYVLVHCGTSDHVVVTFLGVSTDEAGSWQLLPAARCGNPAPGPQKIPDAAELRVDAAGDLYAGVVHSVRTGDGRGYDDTPLLQVSHDHGCTWSTPMRVAPAGLAAHSHHPEENAFQTGQPAPYWPQPLTDYSWDLDAREPGHVAFAFYGSGDRTGRHWNGWITETWDALAASPTFYGAPVNDPTTVNLHDGAYADEYTSGNEHLGMSLSADGTPWGAFTDGTKGFAGYLVRARAERSARGSRASPATPGPARSGSVA